MHRIGFLKSALPLDGERALLSARGIDDVELFDVPADQDRVPLSGALTDADGLVIEWGKAPASLFQENPQLKCCILYTSSAAHQLPLLKLGARLLL